jgi:hypothetical protein
VVDEDFSARCIHFIIWIDGRKVKAGTPPGTTITMKRGSRVVGLQPKLMSAPSELRVALLELESENDDSAAKEIAVYEGRYGRIHSFEPDEKIRFSALRSSRFASRMPAGKGGCCIQLEPNGELICAECYVMYGATHSCCTDFYCCLGMLLGMLRYYL